MTEGLKRLYGGTDLHFLTFSSYQRQPLFNRPPHCDLFLKILERVRLSYRLVVVGYVVMPEHVHLLVSEPQRKTLSTAIQALKLGVVRTLQVAETAPPPMSRKPRETLRQAQGRLWGTPGGSKFTLHHFWMPRFYDFNVWTEKKRIETPLPPPEPRNPRAGGEARRLALDQLPLVPERRTRPSEDQRHQYVNHDHPPARSLKPASDNPP
jgi:putative transposase